jgi:hypothetical protein
MKRAPKMVLALLLMGIVLGLLAAQFHFGRGWIQGGVLDQRELATQFLGQYLAEHCRGNRAIVWSNPFSQKSGQPRQVYQFEKAGLRGLRRGLGTAVTVDAIVFPTLRTAFTQNPASVFIDPATTTPLSYLVAENALDTLVTNYPDASLIVSLIGLPVNLRETKTWSTTNGPAFALLLPDLRMVGSQALIRQALRTRKITAAILNKPGAPPEDQPLGEDLNLEFDRRFLLVTPETVDRYLSIYPRLF